MSDALRLIEQAVTEKQQAEQTARQAAAIAIALLAKLELDEIQLDVSEARGNIEVSPGPDAGQIVVRVTRG